MKWNEPSIATRDLTAEIFDFTRRKNGRDYASSVAFDGGVDHYAGLWDVNTFDSF